MTDDDVIRVLIADDYRPFRRGMRLRLDNTDGIEVIGEVANGRDAVAAAVSERPDVVLMDLEMPEMNGIEATRVIAETSGGLIRVIALTSHGEDHLVRRAIGSGASGYLLKTHDGAQLVDAIRAAHRGDALVSPRVTRALLADVAEQWLTDEDRRRVASLSPSERRIVVLLAEGVTSNDALASALIVSVNTVRSHVQSAMRKVDATDRTQLALWGVRVKAELGRPRGGM